MKKLISLLTALILCFSCTGCGGSEIPKTAAETVKMETADEPAVEAQPLETEAVTEPVLQEPAGDLPKSPAYNFASWDSEGNDTGELEVFDCRMYPTNNGTTIFAVDYKTVADRQLVVFGYADDGNDDPNYWQEIETLTTGEKSTFVFEVENEILDLIYHVGVFFRDQYAFEVGIIEIFHREDVIHVTDGNPVGEAEPLVFTKEGKVTVHNAFMQPLDNGYVRFTLECQPRKDLYVCFYSDPEGERFDCYGGPTSGNKETIVADIWAESVEGLHGFNFSFYKAGEYPDSRVYLNSATTDFAELMDYNFHGFINGAGQFMLVYYGVLDEAILDATLTAEDGSSIIVTEDVLSRNGDGHSLVLFQECKVKRNDTVAVTLSKEGYQDIALNLLVH